MCVDMSILEKRKLANKMILKSWSFVEWIKNEEIKMWEYRKWIANRYFCKVISSLNQNRSQQKFNKITLFVTIVHLAFSRSMLEKKQQLLMFWKDGEKKRMNSWKGI